MHIEVYDITSIFMISEKRKSVSCIACPAFGPEFFIFKIQ